MATLYRVDGTQEEIEVTDLKSLQKAVGGFIEVAWTNTNGKKCLLCNEDGLGQGLKFNIGVHCDFGLNLVGDCLLVKIPQEFN